MEKEMLIVLPRRIILMRDSANTNSTVRVSYEEYSLYFRNFIHPYRAEYDIQIDCDYGHNFGDRWMIDTFPHDKDSFPLTMRIFDEWGELLAERSTEIMLVDKTVADEEFRILCVGDSMTRSQVWIEHLSLKMSHLRFVGSRSYNRTIFHEGRGGWSFYTYFEKVDESPFMYPAGVSGEDYFGDLAYARNVNDPLHNAYCYDGYFPMHIKKGQIYHLDGKLYRALADCWDLSEPESELYAESVTWELDFSKYMAHFGLEKPHMLTILMGANDLQISSYAEVDEKVAAFMQNMERFIASVRAYSADLPIVINLPITGADQYSWGKQLGCRGYAKVYDFKIKKACSRLLELYDGREKENLYISPMLLALDPEYGFSKVNHTTGRYSTELVSSHGNWVHPCAAGYKEMGDALCGIIEYLRK